MDGEKTERGPLLENEATPQNKPPKKFLVAGIVLLVILVAIILGVLGGLGYFAKENEESQDAATRARSLVQQMTSDEKFLLLNGVHWGEWGYYIGNTPSIPRLRIPSLNLHDGPQGFRTLEPEMYGQVTSWPCALAVSSTWDPDLVYDWAQAMAEEFRAKGGNVMLGPGVNFLRVATCGRNAEYLTGEDPYFGSAMSSAYVKGIQSQKVMANIKHFALNNQETNRHTVSANVDERVLWEIYYPAFQAGVAAGVASVMCAYNLINGTYACGNEKNLNGDLREGMGFQGWVLSDWYATYGVWAEEGLDQSMPGDDHYYDPDNLTKIDPTTIDNMVYRILLAFIQSGAFDDPVCTGGGGCDYYLYNLTATTPEHVNLARWLAAQGAQLLQNNGNVLPLSNTTPTLALVGSICNSSQNLTALSEQWDLGSYYSVGGSGRVVSPNPVSIFEGVKNRAESGGFQVIWDFSDDIDTSVSLIQSATVGIVCGATTSTEDVDRANLLLDNDEFIRGVLSLTAMDQSLKTVIIMQTPGPVLTDWRDNATAIVNMFLAGQETGNAWADVLFGDINPSGKLPTTFPLSENDTILPCTTVNCSYSEGLFVGYRGFIGKPVAFPYGHGLSYTTFDFTWKSPPQKTSSCGSNFLVCMIVTVTNVGSRDGAEVVQMYLDYPAIANEPSTILRGFEKVFLPVGSSFDVTFGLASRDLSIYNVSSKSWSVVYGLYEVHIGRSSRDLPLQQNFSL